MWWKLFFARQAIKIGISIILRISKKEEIYIRIPPILSEGIKKTIQDDKLTLREIGYLIQVGILKKKSEK